MAENGDVKVNIRTKIDIRFPTLTANVEVWRNQQEDQITAILFHCS